MNSVPEGEVNAVSLESPPCIHDISALGRAFRPYKGDEMQNQFDPRTTTRGFDPAVSVGVPSVARDAGLRSYMLKVYNLMALGLAITGLAALGTVMVATTNDPASAVATRRTSGSRVRGMVGA